MLILAASLFFYGFWNWKITLLLVLTVWLNYHTALRIHSGGTAFCSRKCLLTAGAALNISFLIYFKYFMFFSSGLLELAEITGTGLSWNVPQILLPVGISFYTFQITGYLADVYRNRIPAEKSYGKLLLFTVYFPQLVAGPVERAEKLLPELSFQDSGNYLTDPKVRDRIASGGYLFLTGLFKKLFVADNLAPFTDIHLIPGLPPPSYGYTAAAVIFAVQIYADFSGYTDMARGLGRILGTELTENFRLPFFASNPSELWRRWHITLMSFLRDYLYIPLGGGRMGRFRELLNIMIVFFIGGLWHGASVGHIVWGLWSGLLVALYRLSQPFITAVSDFRPFPGKAGALTSAGIRPMIYAAGIIYTFFMFSWGALLIRIPSVEQFIHIYSNLFPAPDASPVPPLWPFLLFYMWPVLLTDYLFYRTEQGKPAGRMFQQTWSAIMIVLIIFFGFRGSREFIYFQF